MEASGSAPARTEQSPRVTRSRRKGPRDRRGIGRYGSAQVPDATARPDGTLALIKSAQWLGSFELHPNPKFDFYAYFGQEYAGRAAFPRAPAVA